MDVLQVSCDIRTISWAMSNLGVERIDLLKVDVEGAELVSGIEQVDNAKIFGSHPFLLFPFAVMRVGRYICESCTLHVKIRSK